MACKLADAPEMPALGSKWRRVHRLYPQNNISATVVVVETSQTFDIQADSVCQYVTVQNLSNSVRLLCHPDDFIHPKNTRTDFPFGREFYIPFKEAAQDLGPPIKNKQIETTKPMDQDDLLKERFKRLELD